MKGNYRRCFRGESCDVGWGNMDSNGCETCMDKPESCVFPEENTKIKLSSIKFDPWKTGPFFNTIWVHCSQLYPGKWFEIYCECEHDWTLSLQKLDDSHWCLSCARKRKEPPSIVEEDLGVPDYPAFVGKQHPRHGDDPHEKAPKSMEEVMAEKIYCDCTGTVLYAKTPGGKDSCLHCGKERNVNLICRKYERVLEDIPLADIEAAVKRALEPDAIILGPTGISGSEFIDKIIPVQPMMNPTQGYFKITVPKSERMFFTHIREAWTIIKGAWKRRYCK